MTDRILIADSGSTKTDWILQTPQHGMLEVHTAGINPVRDTQDTIFSVLRTELLTQFPEDAVPQRIYFYGAGCISPFKTSVSDSLIRIFPNADIHVESDLLGAARALCGHQSGIACILGTGSNSCLYDGEQIQRNTSPLGYILGDEGSGAVLGRTLVGNLLKGIFPTTLLQAFLQRFQLTQADIISRVYRQPLPNKFLASLVPFLEEHRSEPCIHQMLVEQFRLFLSRNVRAYGHPEMPVNFVGSIAYLYQTELQEAATLEGFRLGRIIRQPAQGIAQYHI